MTHPQIKVMIVDSHNITRQGLRAILSQEAHFNIIGEAGDGWTALKIIKSDKPDVVLLDTHLPRLNGIDTAKIILERNQDIKILFLSSNDSGENVLEALKAGANGYLLKDCEQSDLVTAIHCLARGHAYLSPAVTTHIIGEYVKCAEQVGFDSGAMPLTQRERQVLQLVCERQTNKEIAQMLNICIKTVEKHRSSMKRKLNVASTRELIDYWNTESQCVVPSNVRQFATRAAGNPQPQGLSSANDSGVANSL